MAWAPPASSERVACSKSVFRRADAARHELLGQPRTDAGYRAGGGLLLAPGTIVGQYVALLRGREGARMCTSGGLTMIGLNFMRKSGSTKHKKNSWRSLLSCSIVRAPPSATFHSSSFQDTEHPRFRIPTKECGRRFKAIYYKWARTCLICFRSPCLVNQAATSVQSTFVLCD